MLRAEIAGLAACAAATNATKRIIFFAKQDETCVPFLCKKKEGGFPSFQHVCVRLCGPKDQFVGPVFFLRLRCRAHRASYVLTAVALLGRGGHPVVWRSFSCSYPSLTFVVRAGEF